MVQCRPLLRNSGFAGHYPIFKYDQSPPRGTSSASWPPQARRHSFYQRASDMRQCNVGALAFRLGLPPSLHVCNTHNLLQRRQASSPAAPDSRQDPNQVIKLHGPACKLDELCEKDDATSDQELPARSCGVSSAALPAAHVVGTDEIGVKTHTEPASLAKGQRLALQFRAASVKAQSF